MRERVPRDATPVPPAGDPTAQFEVAVSTEPAASAAPALPRDRQSALYRRALETLPGGTNSNFRAWGEDTIYVDRGKGGRVWDVDGNEFIDLRMGYGPVILGHGDDRVDDYVNERMRRGVSFSLTSEDEVRAMELVKELTGWVDKARMTVSGTEATMHAMRVARAYTGPRQDREVRGPVPRRPRLRPDQRRRRTTCPSSATPTTRSRLAWGRGIPGAGRRHDHPGPLQQHRRSCAGCSSAQGEEIAAIIVEPVLGNAQGDHAQARLPPGDAGPDRGVRDPAHLRRGQDRLPLRPGGAAEFFGITPDLATYAKAMGNGYPAAAFGGAAEVMSMLPDKVSHGGTYAGNRVAAAAAVKTLEILRDTDALETIHATGRRMQDGLREVLNPTGLPYVFTGHPSMFGIMFTETEPSRVPRLGEHRPRAVRRDRGRDARPRRDARARLARAVVHVRGARRGRHRRPGRSTSFSDSLDAALEDRAHGARGPTPQRRHGLARSRLTG